MSKQITKHAARLHGRKLVSLLKGMLVAYEVESYCACDRRTYCHHGEFADLAREACRYLDWTPGLIEKCPACDREIES